MRQVPILLRISISVLIAISLMGLAAIYFVQLHYASLVNERRAELKRQVEMAVSMVVVGRTLQQSSGKTRSEIDQENFKRIGGLQFGFDNYFNIYEGTILRFNRKAPYFIGRDMRGYKDADGKFPVLLTARAIAEKGVSSFQYMSRRRNTMKPLPKIGYSLAVPGTKYWISMGIYIEDLQTMYWAYITRICIAMLILSLLLLIISVYVSRSITKPLHLIKKRIVDLANGDTGSKVPEVDAKDEIGDLARTVEVFRKNRQYSGELEVVNSQIEQQALHDPLTGLANRRYFETHFINLQEKLSGSNNSIMLLRIDLDRFKEINESFGQVAGDLVLKHTANVLKQKVGVSDFVAHTGGDEFLIIGPYNGELSQVESLARDINIALAEPLPYEGRFCRFGASIGVAFEEVEKADIELLVEQADMALYRAKEHGRNRFEIYSNSLKMELINRSRTIEEFLDGMDMGQLAPYYQPQFDIKTLDLVGIEVLARWIHPERGVLEPEHFLDIAEDQKVLTNISQAIAIQSLRDCVRLQAQDIKVPGLSVNFSSDCMKDPELCNWLEKLQPFPVPFAIELVGTGSIEEDDEVVKQNLARFREMEITIEIDDFGSGQDSILSLLQIKPGRIKIDQKLVGPIPTSRVHEDLVRSVVDIAQSLKVRTIAEGAETLDHLDFLKDLGVDAFQGYALAEPMPYSELVEFLTKQSWRNVA